MGSSVWHLLVQCNPMTDSCSLGAPSNDAHGHSVPLELICLTCSCISGLPGIRRKCDDDVSDGVDGSGW